MLFKFLRRRKVNEIIFNVNHKELFKRYLFLFVGCLILSIAFNIFFLQYGIVCFGTSGLSIVLNEYGINPSIFILVANVILLILSFIILGFQKTKYSIIGSLLFPICIALTKRLVPYVSLDNIELMVIAVLGAVLSGIGYGLVFKTGFTTGGTDILGQIIAKYSKSSMGKSMLVVDALVVLSGRLVFSWEIVLYGFIVLYIISLITDKVILGISQSKAFYIVTDHEEEVREFLLSIIDGGVTLINARGGFSNDKQTMLLGVVPTRQYFFVKEGLKEIDENIFFLVCDAYEVSNKGNKNE